MEYNLILYQNVAIEELYNLAFGFITIEWHA
jgi:hypothetical protein